jgi:hypothetical protein
MVKKKDFSLRIKLLIYPLLARVRVKANLFPSLLAPYVEHWQIVAIKTQTLHASQ